jgi:REP element-mobilizing transposase RayT
MANVNRANRRNSPRLDASNYFGPLVAHVINVTRLREPIFAEASLAQVCIDALNEVANNRSANIHAYCLMPDHLHGLLDAPADESLEDFVKLFKQVSGFRIKRLTGKPVWPVSYYDRILRKQDAIVDVAAYIWDNPVKHGLAADHGSTHGPAHASLKNLQLHL